MKQLLFLMLSCIIMTGDTIKAQFTVKNIVGNPDHLVVETIRPVQFAVLVKKGEFSVGEQLDCKVKAEKVGTILINGEETDIVATVAECHGKKFEIRTVLFPQ